jgi:hypothetical protein
MQLADVCSQSYYFDVPVEGMSHDSREEDRGSGFAVHVGRSRCLDASDIRKREGWRLGRD